MAIQTGGPFGKIKNKLGGIVYRKWNNLNTAAAYQPDVRNPHTEDQELQRALFKKVTTALKYMHPGFSSINFLNFNKNIGAWPNLLKKNFKEQSAAAGYNPLKLVLSEGDGDNPSILSARYLDAMDCIIMTMDNGNPVEPPIPPKKFNPRTYMKAGTDSGNIPKRMTNQNLNLDFAGDYPGDHLPISETDIWNRMHRTIRHMLFFSIDHNGNVNTVEMSPYGPMPQVWCCYGWIGDEEYGYDCQESINISWGLDNISYYTTCLHESWLQAYYMNNICRGYPTPPSTAEYLWEFLPVNPDFFKGIAKTDIVECSAGKVVQISKMYGECNYAGDRPNFTSNTISFTYSLKAGTPTITIEWNPQELPAGALPTDFLNIFVYSFLEPKIYVKLIDTATLADGIATISLPALWADAFICVNIQLKKDANFFEEGVTYTDAEIFSKALRTIVNFQTAEYHFEEIYEKFPMITFSGKLPNGYRGIFLKFFYYDNNEKYPATNIGILLKDAAGNIIANKNSGDYNFCLLKYNSNVTVKTIVATYDNEDFTIPVDITVPNSCIFNANAINFNKPGAPQIDIITSWKGVVVHDGVVGYEKTDYIFLLRDESYDYNYIGETFEDADLLLAIKSMLFCQLGAKRVSTGQIIWSIETKKITDGFYFHTTLTLLESGELSSVVYDAP